MKKRKDSVSTVLITGGGRGLGAVIARRLSRDYNILLVGRTEADLVSVCRDVERSGGSASYIVADVSDSESAKKALLKARDLGWQLTNLVCNAGIGKSVQTHKLELSSWNDTINTNLNGSFYFAQAVLPEFIEHGEGRICFISSIAGTRGYAHEAAYTASKHALVGLTKTLALEYGKKGVGSFVLCPGFIEGSMTDRTVAALAKRRGISNHDARVVVERLNPQRRIIPPEEVAEMVAFICSGVADSLSGNPIMMTGGL